MFCTAAGGLTARIWLFVQIQPFKGVGGICVDAEGNIIITEAVLSSIKSCELKKSSVLSKSGLTRVSLGTSDKLTGIEPVWDDDNDCYFEQKKPLFADGRWTKPSLTSFVAWPVPTTA